MRDYSILNDKGQLIYNYITQLDQQLGNFYDYIKEYNPNYQILNNINSYYSHKDLEKLNLCDFQLHQINATYLNNHQGLLNNFHHPFLLNFSSLQDVHQMIIPRFNTYINGHPTTVSIRLSTDPIQNLTFEDLEGQHLGQKEFLEGYILLSEVKSNKGDYTSNDRQSIRNYILGRVAAPATYFILTKVKQALSQYTTTYEGKYFYNAELTHGIQQGYSFLPCGSNFYYYQNYNDYTDFRAAKTINYNYITINLPMTDTHHASLWTEGYALNHCLLNEGESNIEEIIMDDKKNIGLSLMGNMAVPYYQIQIANEHNESFIKSYPIKVRLG